MILIYMSAIYHNLTNWKPQDVILLILTQSAQQLAHSDVPVITGETQKVYKMEGEIVSGMMEGETLQLALYL